MDHHYQEGYEQEHHYGQEEYVEEVVTTTVVEEVVEDGHHGGHPGADHNMPPQEMYATCPEHHPMNWANYDPYGGEGVTCNGCDECIDPAFWFHHCFTCEHDWCQQCGGPTMQPAHNFPQ